jgi:LysM repeat protein
MVVMHLKTFRRTTWFSWIILLTLCLQRNDLFAQASEAYGLVDAVNAYRESLGLPRLATSGALMVAAQRHAEWMAANYNYSHTGQGGSGPQDRAAAAGFSGSVSENVAGSTEATPAEAVFFWDQSYGHRLTMRQALATHIGAGFAANDEQRLFVLLIGTVPGQASLPTSQPIAGGTPAIGYTPPPGMVWSTNGEMHGQEDSYVPAVPTLGQQVRPTEAAYVMPFDMIVQAEPRADGSIVHIVEVGQTAWAIAARYGVDLREVLTINHLPESPILHPGDVLIIRLGEGQSPPPLPTTPSTHQVRAGESLWTIAAHYNHAVDDLRAWNNLPADAIIQPGDVLFVAPPTIAVTSPVPPTPTLLSPTWTETLLPTDTHAAAAMTSPPPTQVAQAPTPALMEITAKTTPVTQNMAIWLLLVLGILGLFVIALAGAVLAWLVQRERRLSHAVRTRPRP